MFMSMFKSWMSVAEFPECSLFIDKCDDVFSEVFFLCFGFDRK